jgi:hypothetical protein
MRATTCSRGSAENETRTPVGPLPVPGGGAPGEREDQGLP